MGDSKTPRALTNDERKAAEAAFAGRPFDPSWSKAARAVYEGILAARGLSKPPEATEEPSPPGEVAAKPHPEVAPHASPPRSEERTEASESPASPSEPRFLSRDEAIKAGVLIDVTPIAHRVGIPVPCSFSRPLWEIGITAAHRVSEDDLEGRVRDVLMAFRLKLASGPVTSPLVEFPALLSFPPDPVPQTCMLIALAHRDPDAQMAITFLLPGEVSAGILPYRIQ